MEFILDNTGPNGEENITGSQLEVLINDITEIARNLSNVSRKLSLLTENFNAEVESNDSMHTTINNNISQLRNEVNFLGVTVTGLNRRITTDFLRATTGADITTLTSQNAVIGNLTLNSELKADVDSANVKAGNLTADASSISSLNSDNADINKLNVGELTTDAVSVTTVNTDSVTASNASVDNLRVADKLELNGIDLNQLDLKLTGWTNGYLHKMEVKADGIVLIKTPGSSVVISPGNISSNYDKLYAAYEADGVWSVYIDSDLDCQAVVVGEAEINSSLVLKTSVRKNADSNGQPNISNTVKVAVVSSLPRIGQRDVIYVVLGDCAYYCDGQYFYEMASKKRG